MKKFDSFYVLDAQDCILTWGGPSWDRHAPEAFLDASGVDLRGHPLYQYVAGHFTRRFLKAFLAEARATPEGLTRTYRCDSTRLKRLMEMTAEPKTPATLQVTHWLLDETPMAFEVAPVSAKDARLASLHRCSMCNRLRRRRSQVWCEPDALPAPPDSPFWVLHTICKDCQSGVRARLPLAPLNPSASG